MRIPALGSLPNLRRHCTNGKVTTGSGRGKGTPVSAIEWPAPKGLAQLKLGPANNIVIKSHSILKGGGNLLRHTGQGGYENHPHGREADRSMDTRALC